MKKALLLAIFFAAGYQVKAQQVIGAKPVDSFQSDLTNKYFKAKPNNGLQMFQHQLNSNEFLSALNARVYKSGIDHMPIAILPGYSKMPVAKFEGYGNMPVLKLAPDRIIVAPGLKTP